MEDSLNFQDITIRDGKCYEDGELIGDVVDITGDLMFVKSTTEKHGVGKELFFQRIDINL